MPTLRYKQRAIVISVLVVAMLVAGPILVTMGTASGLSNGWTTQSGPQGGSSHPTYYYNVVTMTVSYSIIGGGSPLAPSFTYVLNHVTVVLKLKLTAANVLVDIGSSWSVSPNPLGGSSSTNRWVSNQALSGTASATTIVFTYYHQYLQRLSYSVVGGGVGFSAPIFSANSFGVLTGQTLTTLVTGYWFDAGSHWSAPNPLSGSSSAERWFTSAAVSGTLSGPTTRNFEYQHQFYLTMQPSPAGTGTVSPSNNWYNAAQKVTITATAKTGYKLLSWTGSGAGSYSGTSSSAIVTMNAPVTETANFGVIMTITSNPTGSGYVTVDGAPVKTPQTFTWVIGSTYTIAAASPVSCGAGCQYVFTSWSDGGSQSHTITVPSSPTSYKASFQKQFDLTLNVNPSGAGTISQTNGWFNAGLKVVLTSTANAGHTFKSWKGTGSGSYTGTNPSPTITMNSAITETANFT